VGPAAEGGPWEVESIPGGGVDEPMIDAVAVAVTRDGKMLPIGS